MDNFFQIRTKGGSSPSGKPRVYFTCHPADFDRWFDKVCTDIFKTHDVAIFYTADMTQPSPAENREVDLYQMNLFVVPVTFRLMHEPNRAMDEDIAFAKEKGVPILPIMMESRLEEIYAQDKNFGKRQFLAPFEHDPTAIRYEDKLQKYLDALLVSDEMAQRIRKAFDAYIFLSYRKKDRRFANELMRLIHSDPLCHDIAIWYDEFLIPGENFDDSIAAALEKSELFTLLVTPSLLETPNYIMDYEYPAAHSSGKPILPAEMQRTDKDALREHYTDIPDSVRVEEEAALREALLERVRHIALAENDNDPEHNFLIGLAYIDGVDVEVNRERGLELITKAAEADLPEAMEQLYVYYDDGTVFPLDWNKALYWAEKIYQYCLQHYDVRDENVQATRHNLAGAYSKTGNFSKALKLFKEVYEITRDKLGDDDPQTLMTLNNLAYAYANIGNDTEALKLFKNAYKTACGLLNEKAPELLAIMSNLADAYSKVGDYEKALELCDQVYHIRREELGETDASTLISLNNLAYAHGNVGHLKEQLKLHKEAYKKRFKVLGEKHPDTLHSLHNLAYAYDEVDEDNIALVLHNEVYAARCEVLGERHPDTLKSLNNLAYIYLKIKDYQNACEKLQLLYHLLCETKKKNDSQVIEVLFALAQTYDDLHDEKNAEKTYELFINDYCLHLGNKNDRILYAAVRLKALYLKHGETLKLNALLRLLGEA